MFDLLLIAIGLALVSALIAYDYLCGARVSRFGFMRPRDRAIRDVDLAPPAPPETRRTPTVGDTVHEIGVLLALHLALAIAVLLTLRAFGVS